MITIMGATGHTGGAAADELLKQNEKIRVIGRSKDRLKTLAARGAEIAVGDAADAAFLTSAFRGSDAVYVLIPPDLASTDYPAHQDKVGEAITKAIKDSGVKHVVLLSSVGAELPSGTGPIAGLHRQEERLKKVAGLNSLFLRAAYFFENQFGYLELVKSQGINGGAIAGDLPIPMIASADIGRAAAHALKKRDFKGAVVHELLGQRDLTFNEATGIIGKAIERPDLKYVQFPYAAALDGMITMGISKSIAEGFVEMSRAFNEKRVKSVEGRNAKNTTPTRFEDFAAHVLAPAYRTM
jgi:uncharacterized protein YbjT (DUF2867 family)